MPTDPMRIRAHLAAQRRLVRQLDLIEEAEELLRGYCQQILVADLVKAHEELREARYSHRTLLGGDELARLVLAEDHLRTVQKRVTMLTRRGSEERFAAAQARTLYTTRRALLMRNITQLQLLQRRTHTTESSPR
jgi:hypothetical protein